MNADESKEDSFLWFLDNMPAPIKHNMHGANYRSPYLQPLKYYKNDENSSTKNVAEIPSAIHATIQDILEIKIKKLYRKS